MELRLAGGEADGDEGRENFGGFAGRHDNAENADLTVFELDFVRSGGEFGGGGGLARRVVVEFHFDDFEGGAAGVLDRKSVV